MTTSSDHRETMIMIDHQHRGEQWWSRLQSVSRKTIPKSLWPLLDGVQGVSLPSMEADHVIAWCSRQYGWAECEGDVDHPYPLIVDEGSSMCIYCEAVVPHHVEESQDWIEIQALHQAECEWAQTRAHTEVRRG